MKRKVLQVLGAMVVATGLCTANSARADKVIFEATALDADYGGVHDFGPAYANTAHTEIGGEFTFKATVGLGAVVKDTGQLFRTFCVDTSTSISETVEYTAVLSSTPSFAIGATPVGEPTMGKIAYLFDTYRVTNGFHSLAHFTNQEDLAAAVQLEIWKLLGTTIPAAANSTAVNNIVGDLDLLNPNLSQRTTAEQNVAIMSLYDSGGHLAQSQLVAFNSNDVTTPLPGVAWMGLVSLTGLAGLRVYRGKLA